MTRAKKSLGQNFLKSPAVSRKMVETANLGESDTVLEIGPGKGALTKELLKSGAKVVAVEKDTEMTPILKERFAEQIQNGRLELINDDISNFTAMCLPIDTYKVVANIPYYITGEILRMFLESDRQPQSMTLLVQKEVAQRIVARNAKESILSMSVKAYGEPKYVQKVPAMLFSPAPKVDSAILHIADISKDFFKTTCITEQKFFNILKRGFAQKRKKLTNTLGVTPDVLIKSGIDVDARAETLTLEQWAKLTRLLSGMI